MPYRDEAGVKHVLATDPISDGSRLHLLSCKLCQDRFPNNAKLVTEFERAYIMARYDEESITVNANVPMQDRRFVEDDLMQLAEIDEQIRMMVTKRAEVVDAIKKQNNANCERVMVSDDWFEGSLKGNPIPARDYDPGPTEAPRRYNGAHI